MYVNRIDIKCKKMNMKRKKIISDFNKIEFDYQSK